MTARGRTAVFVSLACAGALAASCGPDPVTEIMVVVDSDMMVPGELDAVRIEVTGPTGMLKSATAPLSGEGASTLPVTLGVVHRDGSLGPLMVVVSGDRAGANVVTRTARVSFITRRTVVLRMDLVRSCVGIMCPAERTCAPGGCRPINVDPSELATWPGYPPRLGDVDGGTPPDGCVPMPELCNNGDDDCDLRVDEDFDLGTDRDHCGACDSTCPIDPPHGAGTCTGGVCALLCDPGFEDCDADGANGCETSLLDPRTCGRCDSVCSGATPFCAGTPKTGYSCLAMCGMGTMECGGSCPDTQTNPLHCSACGLACPDRASSFPICVAGSCDLACDPGYHDCDGDPASGCESDLRDVTNCGGCGVMCALPNAVEACGGGSCGIVSCDTGWDNCDTRPENGCETSLTNDPTHCGRCDRPCAIDPSNSTSVCTAGSCSLACAAGWADCDSALETGCETSLGDPAHCGACATACTGATPICDGNPISGYACSAACSATNCSGSCVDTETDPRNCARCGNVCPDRAGSTATCSGGRCAFMCDSGRGDCDGNAGNGCETDLRSSTANCGTCSNGCDYPNAMGACVVSTCSLGACIAGYSDCDGQLANGCERSTRTLTDCGGCGIVCALRSATESCSSGICDIVTCDPNHGDCDGRVDTGCEIDLNRDRRNCGICGNACAGAERCCGGVCGDRPC